MKRFVYSILLLFAVGTVMADTGNTPDPSQNDQQEETCTDALLDEDLDCDVAPVATESEESSTFFGIPLPWDYLFSAPVQKPIAIKRDPHGVRKY